MRRLTMIYLLLVSTFFLIPSDGTSFFNVNDLDWSIRPADNFYAFVNGLWWNRTIIPPSETEWGGVYTMSYKTSYKLKGILDDVVNNLTLETSQVTDSVKRKLADLYLSGLDEQTIEQINIQPLKETIIQLENINSYQELITFILNWYKKTDFDIIFKFDVAPDERNTSRNIASWSQSGIVLPEQGYYFRNDTKAENIRLNYINYIDRLLNLTNHILNITTDLSDAKDILLLETQLADVHHTNVETRNPDKTYHKYTVTELDRMMPHLGWHHILNVSEIRKETIIISEVGYYQLLDKLIVSVPLNVWKTKIRFTILHQMAEYLNKDFETARFHMFDHIIYGQLKDKPRWAKIIKDINAYSGDLLGQIYVSRYFPSKAQKQASNLANQLVKTYRKRIKRNEWMSDITKTKALRKLNKMRIKIGYPSKWETYDTVHTNRWSYFDSMGSIFQYNYRKKIDNLHKPIDRTVWAIDVAPQIPNSYYNTIFNEMIIPAGILQEPHFIFDADDAINYGAIGRLMAHELTHGFDDQGRKYDENGNVHLWWTQTDINQFNSRVKLIVEQYNNYKILNTTVDGLLTEGENIADLGGLEIAYEAFLNTEQAKAGILIDRLTPNQRFFLSFARNSRTKTTTASLLETLETNAHAPAIVRVNAPLSNMMGFYQAFNVTENDKMFREPSKRVRIW